MKLRDKYPKLQDPCFVKEMIVRSVYGSMALSGKEVSRERLNEIYEQARIEPVKIKGYVCLMSENHA